VPLKLDGKFHIGASHIIGSYILPGEIIDSIQEKVDSKIKITIAPYNNIVKAIKEDKLDLAFVEFALPDDELTHKVWMEDELTLCSKMKLSNSLTREDLSRHRLVSREEGSLNYRYIENFLKEQNINYSDFDSISEVSNPTAIIQSIKWSRPNIPVTALAFVSRVAIEYELKYNELYTTTINNTPIFKKFYLLYKKDSPLIDVIKNICNELKVEYTKR